ncbi:MAG: NAD(P)/FAD-dependent oxidoreductase [Peptoanaerobacter stomatis]
MITISNIKISLNEDEANIKDKITKKLKLKNTDIHYKILKESLDARKRDNIHFIYQVLVDADEKKLNKHIFDDADVKPYIKQNIPILKKGSVSIDKPILVVGSGPAGLFCAYKLSLYGYKTILIERGKDVDKRSIDVENFWKTSIINENSNVQFGEGGAGTFSDGKLTSRSKDIRGFEVLETFHKFGADENILYKQKPHIGTDILKNVVKNMRNSISSLGTSVRFENKLEDFIIENNIIKSAVINGENIDVSMVVLAIGHSARDTFGMLYKNNISMLKKPFAVGFRIEHLQENIDKAQYKENYNNPKLSSSEYFLTNALNEVNRSVYTFCMCPGGYVIPSSSSKEELVVNGMSYNARDGVNANSAILVNVRETDFNSNVLGGVDFQKECERKAFILGGGNYKAPVQRIEDFLNNTVSTHIGKVKPTYEIGYKLSNLNEIYKKELTESIKKSIIAMDKKVKGFADKDAILTGVETRTSSPVRILRNPDNLNSVSISNLYPCGEGGGYAGGIVSSAIDGLKIAEKIIENYIFI